ncbi:MAG: insulinase family protein [Bacteroidetes bacterium]|nr:insulinase family protein [Bacteroidota bacterium]
MRNTLKYLLPCLLFLGITPAFAQYTLIEKVEPNTDNTVIPYLKYRLDTNNLTLIIHEDHSDPIAHVQVAYHVGSARENVGNSGFAHFFEHMMFQGSKNVADEEHFKIISEAGGTNNAFTSFDKTVYHQTAPSNLTETMLWLEADRMGTHLDGFTLEKFNNQRDAVKNEKRQRYDNQPYGMVSEVLFKTMYPNLPYEWTPIGFVDDLDAADFNDLRNFFLRWYGPNNATVVVSGDVNPEEVKKWVLKYFGTINQCPEVRSQRPFSPIMPTDQYQAMTDNIFLPLTSMSFPTVENYHRDQAALDILSELLGGGNNSLLYKKLVKTEQAVQASAGHNSLELSGFMNINVVGTFMGLNFKETEDKIREVLNEFGTTGISDEELARIKMVFKSSIVDQANSVQSKALLLSEWSMMKGNGYNLKDELDRYETVTKEDVMRVYRKYIQNRKAVILNVGPEPMGQKQDEEKSKSVNPHAGQEKKIDPQYVGLTYNPPKDNFDRSKRPVVPAGKTIKVPEYYSTKFENGLKVIGARSEESPKVYLYIEMAGGHLLEADKKIQSGTAYLTSQMMDEGTKTKTSEEFSAALDRLGSNISYGSNESSTTIFVQCFRENLDATLKLLEESMTTPRFDAKDFQRIKKQNLDGLRNQKSSPSYLAQNTFNQIMFEGSILAEYYTGDAKTISKISVEDCINFYNQFYSPNVATLSIVGPINEQEVMSKIGFLKNWKNKNVVVPALPEPKTVEKTTIVLVDKPYAPQSLVIAGYPSLKYDFKGDFYKNTVMNFALGGAFNSRINLNLREDKGYTYGARSGFSGNEYYGRYVFSGNIKKEATDSSIMELMKELINYKSGGITDEELAFTKSSILLSKALDYETPFQKLGFLNGIIQYDLPKDYTQQQADIVNKLTKAEINALAQKYIKPENLLIIVVGHAYKVKPGLENLGYGKVKVIEYQ